jgi:hypothetical protein
MMKSIVLTLLLFYFIDLKIAAPWITLRVNEHELNFNLRKYIPPLHHRLIGPNEIVVVPHELICRSIVAGFGSLPISAVMESAEDKNIFLTWMRSTGRPKYLSGSSWMLMQEMTADSSDVIPAVTLPLVVIAVLRC